jgi:SAM-dependent methyltransferase
MTQNIYDNQQFFDAYGCLERSIRGLDGAPEWPALRALLPDLRGRRVLDLGCGYGWLCRWASACGAVVRGIDVSDKMLERARTWSQDDGIAYERADLEDVVLPAASFDVVYSSLAFHYLVNLPELVSRIHRALVPGGRLIFSVEHPVLTATHVAEWVSHAHGRAWPVDHYFDEGPRTTDWLVKGVVKQHRTIGTYLTMLVRSGFAIAHVEDWCPTLEQVTERPDWETERDRPLFLLVSATRLPNQT